MLAHARALLVGAPQGETRYINADMHEPDKILAAAGDILDFTQPVAVMLMGVLGHVADLEEARSIVNRLLDPLPTGSYLALWDGTDVVKGEAGREAQEGYDESGAVPYRLSKPAEIASYFDGLEPVAPGVVSLPRWRPETDELPDEVDAFGGVGRKP